MEEDPRQHDFDQRHDGPRGRPSVQIATNLPRRHSEANAKSAPVPGNDSDFKSFPTPEPESRMPPARHSTQLTRNRHVSDQFGRRSAQISRSNTGGDRPSRDFDVRRDGPYGRPSLNMTRRRSSGAARVNSNASKDEDVPPMPIIEGAAITEPPASMETMQSSDPAFEPEPPPLNYTLWTRKWSIALFWGLIIVDSTVMPIALYFGLWYGTSLSPNTVFSIVTAALGGVSILEYVLRFRRLWRKNSTCRVIGARRSYLDYFHWNFSLAWTLIIIELIVGTVFPNPPIRLLSMPLATMCFVTGFELLFIDILRYFEVPAPIRVSSIPKGSQLRPGIYSVIEDVIAVDGSGGTEFREALNRRYEASHVFRQMLRRLGAFWAFGAIGIAVATTVLVFTLGDDPAYCVGWSVPFIWAGVWTIATYWYVKKKLREEKVAWADEVAAKSRA